MRQAPSERVTDMAWQPEQEALRQLSGCLKDSLSGQNKNAQKQAEIVSFFFGNTSHTLDLFFQSPI